VDVVGPAVEKNDRGAVDWPGLDVADVQDARVDLLQ
jgi:hypothetical protein